MSICLLIAKVCYDTHACMNMLFFFYYLPLLLLLWPATLTSWFATNSSRHTADLIANNVSIVCIHCKWNVFCHVSQVTIVSSPIEAIIGFFFLLFPMAHINWRESEKKNTTQNKQTNKEYGKLFDRGKKTLFLGSIDWIEIKIINVKHTYVQKNINYWNQNQNEKKNRTWWGEMCDAI